MTIEPPPQTQAATDRAVRLDSFQAGRAIAAISVLLYHLDLLVAAQPWFGRHLHPLLGGGSAGVEFFFVLSGFLMMWLYREGFGKDGQAAKFLRKRLKRIYPTYWLALFPICVLFFIIPRIGEGFERNPADVISSILLLPWIHPPIIGVAWTLRFEMWFYVLFALLIWKPRLLTPLLALYVLLLATLPTVSAFPFSFFLDDFVLLFFYGMTGALAAGRLPNMPRRTVELLAVTAAAGFLGLVVAHQYQYLARTPERNLLGVTAAIVLFSLARLEQSGSIKTPKVLRYLGDASYSIYLVHYVALSIAAKGVTAIGLARGSAAGAIATIGLFALLAGIAFHEIAEKRILKFHAKTRHSKNDDLVPRRVGE